jgi:ABC-type branched-subunit amino acid transport system substrate-binding protein/serine/threonine protein kinase
MGAALLAHDSRISNKAVVIKELVSDSSDATQRQEDQRNFEREVETLAQIDHPLVPRVTDYFQEGTHSFMVQDYVAGENLEDHMDRIQAPMPEREALGYMSQLLDVLDYLEHQSPPIVHRDIKPANIIVGAKDKRAHLVDFGIARAEVAKKQTSALGTPGYAPPEQYQGKADIRSDLYALAATIHHLVTNRDPRNAAPFTYPSARSVNPNVSPDLDHLLTKSLTIDANKRYQNAAEMKRDVDGILAKRFQTSQDTSSYLLGTSGPVAAVPSTTPTPQPVQSRPQQPSPVRGYPAQQPQQQSARAAYPAPQPVQQPVQQQRPANNPYQTQMGTYSSQPARPKRQRGSNPFVFSFLLLLVVIALIAGAFFILPNLSKKSSTPTGGTTTGSGASNVTATAPPFTPPASGIGVQTVGTDSIGISDGTRAFDTTGRADASFKTSAAQALASGDRQGAESNLRQAIASEPNDAEAQIYLEDLRVLDSGSPYVTFVVATMLSQDNIGVGRDDLQGAYIAQKEANANSYVKMNGGTKVRILIASSGSNKTYAQLIAQQIVTLSKNDKTFVGVMGWPFSSRTEYATPVLQAAHIPMISQSSSDDSLSGSSPYFFRVSPSNKSQAQVGANYASSTLKAKNAALFVDYSDPYSQSLAQDFTQQFTANGGKIAATEQYKVGSPSNLSQLLQDALSKNPDIIYYSGYAADISTLLTSYPSGSNVPIVGGDALYELGGYAPSAKAGFTHLHFTAFFYPDVWTILAQKSPQPFSDYSSVYGANGKSGYGYNRIDSDAALSYDATLALINGYNKASSSGGTVTPDQLRNGLTQVSFQGISGHISFDTNGDPVNKAVSVLKVGTAGNIMLELPLFGKFFG